MLPAGADDRANSFVFCSLPLIQYKPMQGPNSGNIPKETLLEIIRKLLHSDLDLSFLMKLEQREIEQLIAAIRGRIDAGR